MITLKYFCTGISMLNNVFNWNDNRFWLLLFACYFGMAIVSVSENVENLWHLLTAKYGKMWAGRGFSATNLILLSVKWNISAVYGLFSPIENAANAKILVFENKLHAKSNITQFTVLYWIKVYENGAPHVIQFTKINLLSVVVTSSLKYKVEGHTTRH